MATLALLFSRRIRRRVLETPHRIGCSRCTVSKLHATETAIVFRLAAVLAAAAITVTLRLLPDLARPL